MSVSVLQQLTPRGQDTADRILAAAKTVFQEKGYDAATTREIAERAGSNIGLIRRYYGSKLELFDACIRPDLGLGWALRAPPGELADRLADFYSGGTPREGFDPFLTMVRSIASPEAGPLLIDILTRQALDPLTERLGGGPDGRARATLIASQLAGLILQYRIMGLTPLDDAERAALRARLHAYLSGLIEGA